MEAAAVSQGGGSQFDEGQYDRTRDDELMNKSCDEAGIASDASFYKLLSEIVEKERLVEIGGSPVEDVEKSVDVIGIMPFFGTFDVIQQFPSSPCRTNFIYACIFKQVDRTLVECQALVLSPTRQQAQEIERVMRVSGADLAGMKIRAYSPLASVVKEESRASGIKIRACSSLVKEETNLSCHVLVATPADVFDLISSDSLTTDNISMFVLDDADQMLSRGFRDQILEVFRLLPPNLQVGMFSETAPDELLQLSDDLMHPKEVQLPAKKPKT